MGHCSCSLASSLPPPSPPLPINRAEEGALYRGTVRQACWDTDWWQAAAERNVVNGQQIQLGSSRPRPTPAQPPDSTQILQLRHDVEISEKNRAIYRHVKISDPSLQSLEPRPVIASLFCVLLSRDCRHGYRLAGIHVVCAKYRYGLHVHVQCVQRGSPSPNKHQPPHPPPRPMQRQEGPHQQLKRDISSLSPHWFYQGTLSSSAVDPLCVPAHTTN